MYQHENKLDEVRIALWEDDGRLVGWTWLWLPQTLFSYVLPEHRAGALFEEMLAWFEAEAPRRRGAARRRRPGRARGPTVLLERRGYRLVPTNHGAPGRRSRHPRGSPPPGGVRAAPRLASGELAARVDVHRAAFAPSRVTTASYGASSRSRRTAPSSTGSRSRPTAATPRSASSGSTTRTASRRWSPSARIPTSAASAWRARSASPPSGPRAARRGDRARVRGRRRARVDLYTGLGFRRVDPTRQLRREAGTAHER